jgi:hypothetical protein
MIVKRTNSEWIEQACAVDYEKICKSTGEPWRAGLEEMRNKAETSFHWDNTLESLGMLFLLYLKVRYSFTIYVSHYYPVLTNQS